MVKTNEIKKNKMKEDLITLAIFGFMFLMILVSATFRVVAGFEDIDNNPKQENQIVTTTPVVTTIVHATTTTTVTTTAVTTTTTITTTTTKATTTTTTEAEPIEEQVYQPQEEEYYEEEYYYEAEEEDYDDVEEDYDYDEDTETSSSGTSDRYVSDYERNLLLNLTSSEYGSDYVSTEEKSKICATVLNIADQYYGGDIEDAIYASCVPFGFNPNKDYYMDDSIINAVDNVLDNEEAWSDWDATGWYGDGTWNYFH